MEKIAVLLVDDEQDVREAIADYLKAEGHEVVSAGDGASALQLAQSELHVAIVDLYMPGLTGMQTVRRLKEIAPDMEVIILTGQASVESAIEAVHEHVFDYICKPVEMKLLCRAILRAAERRHLILANRELTQQLEAERDGLRKQFTAAKRALEYRLSPSASLVGESEAIARIRRFIAEVAPDDITVLIRGESGTGKDVTARLIHESSGRATTGEFLKINCPAIPEALIESELFGHEAGAFTGANGRKPGRFELAARGTVFLDEIGALPANLQAKLLQVIEQKQFTRLGGQKTISVDTRVVAATNASLETMIAEGSFRADLFYRLNEYSIELPPLRDRPEDVPLLAQHFLRIYSEKSGRQGLAPPSAETMAALVQYNWPGNVRELESVFRRFALNGEEESILSALTSPDKKKDGHPAADALRKAEIQTILASLTETHWNQRRAAKALGISYSALRRKIAKYDIKRLYSSYVLQSR